MISESSILEISTKITGKLRLLHYQVVELSVAIEFKVIQNPDYVTETIQDYIIQHCAQAHGCLMLSPEFSITANCKQ
jgi:hypothetical protein